jgi:hypothetical protein
MKTQEGLYINLGRLGIAREPDVLHGNETEGMKPRRLSNRKPVLPEAEGRAS